MEKKEKIVWIFLHLHRSAGTTFNGQVYKYLKPEKEYIHIGSPWLTDKERKKIIPFEKRSLNEREKAKLITGHLVYYGIHKLVPGKTPRYITLVRDPAERIVSYYNGKDWENTKKIPTFEEWYKVRRKNEMVHFFSAKFEGMRETANTPLSLIRLNAKIPGGEKRIYRVKSFFKKFNYFKSKKKESEMQEFENAKKVLDLCWFVGITELDEDISFLFKSVGVPDKKWERYGLTGNTKTKEINPLHKKSEKRFILDEKMRRRMYADNSLDLKLFKYALELNKKRKEELKFPKSLIKNVDRMIKIKNNY